MKTDHIGEIYLQNSFFYPASNGDVFPLVKFEFDTFIYVDFMYDIQILLSEMNSYLFKEQNDPYRINGDVRDYKFSELFETKDLENSKYILKNLLPEKEWDYLMSYVDVPVEESKVQIVDLAKRSGKRSKVIFINHEGLLTYLLLFRCGQIAPLVLCNTVTGHSVRLEKVFPELLKQMNAKPEIWMIYDSKSDLYGNHLGKIEWDGSCETIPVDVYSYKDILPDDKIKFL